MDPLGHPHISYLDDSDPTNYVLKHAFWDGIRWRIEVVDDGDEDVGWWNAIAIDPLGHIHLSYNSGYPTYALKYAYFNGTNWIITSLENNAGYSSSISIDSNNYPHISHINTANELRYVRYDGNNWIAETIASGALWFGNTSSVLTSSGNAHISFIDSSLPRRLFWANNLSGTWEVNCVDEDGRDPSIALDSIGNPHIAYVAAEIKYARFDGTSWQIQTLTDGFGLSGPKEYPSMKLDLADHPHISFGFYNWDTDKDVVSYIYFDGVEWLYSLIDSNDSFYPSLALDKGGFPHVSYRSVRNGLDYLKHAYIKGVAPSPPTNVQASDGTYLDKVEVVWKASDTTTSYTVYRATSSSTWASKTNLGSTPETFFNDTTAVPKTTYYYYVKASNTYGTSSYSAYDKGYRSDGRPPPPTNVQASDGAFPDCVRVSWTVSPDATSYTIYRATSTSRRATKVAIGTTSDTSYDDTTASVMVNYYYYVNASNSYGTSAYSVYDKGYRSDGRPPPPTNVQASDGTYTDKVQIIWTASPDATSYTIYRATSTSRRASKVAIGTTSETNYDDTTALAGKTYYYWVKASNTYGTSGFSVYDTGYR
jgi:fibronectin type 3 domain-containing protein